MNNEWRDLPTMEDVAAAQAVEEEMTTREQYEEWFIKTFDSRPFPPASAPAFDFCWAGYQAGAASRDAEIQRLQMALADAEALELGTAEKCDQLRAHVNRLKEALGKHLTELMDIAVANGANSVSMPDEYVATALLLSSTPEQSLAEYRNKVIEAFVNEFSRHVGGDGEFWLHELQDFAMKEQP